MKKIINLCQREIDAEIINKLVGEVIDKFLWETFYPLIESPADADFEGLPNGDGQQTVRNYKNKIIIGIVCAEQGGTWKTDGNVAWY